MVSLLELVLERTESIHLGRRRRLHLAPQFLLCVELSLSGGARWFVFFLRLLILLFLGDLLRQGAQPHSLRLHSHLVAHVAAFLVRVVLVDVALFSLRKDQQMTAGSVHDHAVEGRIQLRVWLFEDATLAECGEVGT